MPPRATRRAADPNGARPPGRPPGRRPRTATPAVPPLPFPRRLVLCQWLLGLFGCADLKEMLEPIRDERDEGLGSDGIHIFHAKLLGAFGNRLAGLTPADLRRYEENIVSHTNRLNAKRRLTGDPIVWKHYQYLSLLFVEIYLERYFRNAEGLRDQLNARIDAFNGTVEEASRITPFDTDKPAREQLNKLALWCATGAGKTLLMHANILQYQHHLREAGEHRDLDHVVLLTPNEGLTGQHLAELNAAGLPAEAFRLDEGGTGALFQGRTIEVIDINKLRDKSGQKTVDVKVFEGRNLVLVDEGHRGLKRNPTDNEEEKEVGVWKRFRDALCRDGFSFEYSATFQQAVAGSRRRTDEYARSIVIDYSYPRFYRDGFGKLFQILNLTPDIEDRPRQLDAYLTGCLLAFVQQQIVYERDQARLKPWGVEKPLCVFVGSRVNAEGSDVRTILGFLARFLANGEAAVATIGSILQNGLVNAQQVNLFANRFVPLIESGMTPQAIHAEALHLLFHARAGGALRITHRKGAGEIVLAVGANPPFGVINVGNAKDLYDGAAEISAPLERREETVSAAESLFAAINDPDSTINVLIGSKKFTEGWNSWRVSTMGLMNVGTTEGAQVIQLFGRGVRLKGWATLLKRSAALRHRTDLPAPPAHLHVLETLNVFGVRASYMGTFNDYLNDEDLGNPNARETIPIAVYITLPPTRALPMVRLQDRINGVSMEWGHAFRTLGPVPTLAPPPSDPQHWLNRNKVTLNWYPRIEAMKARDLSGGNLAATLDEVRLDAAALAFLDLDDLYFALEQHKAERGWHNLNLTRDSVRALLRHNNWYSLYCPQGDAAFDRFDKLPEIRAMVLALLKKYLEHFYKHAKKEWESQYLAYVDLTEDDKNFFGQYAVHVDPDRQGARAHLENLRVFAELQATGSQPFGPFQAANLDLHLYRPVLTVDRTGGGIEITPTALNEGEWRFLQDLQEYITAHPDRFEGRHVYVLRNRSIGRGVGFFEAGNFHPDFIVWVVDETTRHMIFADPKGLRQVDEEDRRVQFFQTVKDQEREIRKRGGDPSIHLHSFIVSNTPAAEVPWAGAPDEAAARHILFQEEGGETYIARMFDRIDAVMAEEMETEPAE